MLPKIQRKDGVKDRMVADRIGDSVAGRADGQEAQTDRLWRVMRYMPLFQRKRILLARGDDGVGIGVGLAVLRSV